MMAIILQKINIMKTVIATFLIVLCSVAVFGQTIEPAGLISHSNYHTSAANISLHASLGEIATESLSTNDQYLSQGFLQVFIDLVPTANLAYPDLAITVGPNPCTSFFTIIKNQDIKLNAYLFDGFGHLIKTSILKKQRTVFDMESFPAGSYFLMIHNGQQSIFKTSKIIKI